MPNQARSDGDWIVLDEFVDDASDPGRRRSSPASSTIADAVSQRAMELTRDMMAVKVETSEIVRRVLEMIGPSLELRARDELRQEIANQIRSYHDSFTG